jgi:RNA-directed DNA polymerase
MTGSDGREPASVLVAQAPGRRAGEAEPGCSRAEPKIWTKRMLAALETGVAGGKWYSLIDKLYPETTLRLAFDAVAANHGAAGVDHVGIEHYAANLEANLGRLSQALRTGAYRPQAIRRHYIPKPGSQERRPLGIPTVQDRVVQTALRMVLEPIFEHDFAEHSYGFRPGRGCKDALRRVDGLLKAGYVHVVDADLKSYFDTIPKDRLLTLVGKRVADGRILALIQSYLEQGVRDGDQEWTPDQGTPQGAVISPLLSNIYLDPLDHLMAEQGFEMVRYADDFVVLCRSPADAAAALTEVRAWTARAGLELHPAKTRLVDARTEGFDFLGYHFRSGRRVPRKKSLEKLKDTVRAKTKRTRGDSLAMVIADLNRTLRGWFEYFKHSHRRGLDKIDGWIRRRLRSLLRRQQRMPGIAKTTGADQSRWPNAFFESHGLFNLLNAHAIARQSPRG